MKYFRHEIFAIYGSMLPQVLATGNTDDEVKATYGLGINHNGDSYGTPVVNCRISLKKWHAVELNTRSFSINKGIKVYVVK